MLIPTIVLGVVAGILVFVVHTKGGDAMASVRSGLTTTVKIFPILAFALMAASALEHIIPEDWIIRWIGAESGARGIFIGTLAGALCPPGGAIVVYGMVAGLLKAGAGVGTMVALVTSYNLMALHRIPFEISMLGWQFLVVRLMSVILLAPIAGFIAQIIVKFWRVNMGN